jgi:hypothetical protein
MDLHDKLSQSLVVAGTLIAFSFTISLNELAQRTGIDTWPTLSVTGSATVKPWREMARGDAAYELNEPTPYEPAALMYSPIHVMSDMDRERFEHPPTYRVWPEVGGRGSQRTAVEFPGPVAWLTVQPGAYRYMTVVGDDILVRIVITKYLACEVRWSS